MMKPTVISYATDDALYRDHLEKMVETVRARGLSVWTEVIESRGVWRPNMQMKPRWIRDRRVEMRGLLVWLDADARLKGELEMAEGDWDVGVFRVGGVHPRTGTVVLADTEGCRELMERWVFCQDRMGRANDQVTLETAIREMGEGLKVWDLPRSWCAVRGRRGGWKHGVRDEDVVVGHEQASRVARRGLGA
jgi:hypothetical protein